MLAVGAAIPAEATVWLGPNDPHRLAEIIADGPILLLFYPFDWSGT